MWPAVFLFYMLNTGLCSSVHANPWHTIPIRRQVRLNIQDRDTVEGAGISSVSFTDDKQSYYAVIETGEINFRVALDTASSDLWVASSACSTRACSSNPRYPLNYQSPSFVPVNNNDTAFGVSYADGTSASGFVARESVTLSGLKVDNQAFGLVTTSNVTMDDQVSGVLGLGFPRLSVISALEANGKFYSTPFFVTLAQQGQLEYPIFGLSLTRNTTGTLSIGAVDSSVVKNVSNIKWNEVVPFPPFGSERNTSSYLQWAIPFSTVWVNGTPIDPIPTYPGRANTSVALLDIGTAGLYGPYQDVSRLFELLVGSRLVDEGGQWAVPCDISATITFTFGGRNYTLQPSDYLIGPAAGNPNLCLTWPRASPPSPDGIDWQIGAAFLRTVYTVFSYGINAKEPPQVGFYSLTNVSTIAESPDMVSSFLSAASVTIATTLPNFPLVTPTPTTPPYVLNTSVPASLGQVVSSDLATSTYSPIVGVDFFNASALPTISPSPTLVTFTVTNSDGMLSTSVTTLTPSSISLGVPPGWNKGTALRTPLFMTVLFCFISFSLTHIFDT